MKSNGHDQGPCRACGNSSKYGLLNGLCDECSSGETASRLAYEASQAGRLDRAYTLSEAGYDVDFTSF